MSRRRRNDGGEADGRASKTARRRPGADEDEAPLPGARRRQRGYYYLHHPQARRRRRTRALSRRPTSTGRRLGFAAGASGRWWPNAFPRHGPGRTSSRSTAQGGGPTAVYDTEAAALTFASPLPGRLSSSGAGLAVVVEDGGHGGGEALYALTSLGERMPASFEALSWARDPCASPSSLLFSSSSSPGRHYYWSWKNVADTPPPFAEEEAVTAYAGYFDGELDAWVGLHREVHGRVCACQVASRGGARPPEYRETLDYDSVSSSRSKNRRQRATLTYMGDGMFCAVETCETPPTSSSSSEGGGGGGGVEVHVTVFGLKYNRRGELQARVRRAAGAFPLPKQHVPSFSPVAFWM
ncbi:hypothetical protein OsJ_36931 [Oryza sativa Japonica Group]|uniref:Uncharacterized protein n=1 Tax=Oryza sativa subsp. japonica TaxID=39947 RepID=A3CJL5_ORYSJ|nr:hypothetical protein OsJ_36931 [Oryza sativa Japonica Group]